MKKKLACLVLAVAMLLVVVPSVADSVLTLSTLTKSYSAGSVSHEFNTGTVTRSGGDIWMSVKDRNTSLSFSPVVSEENRYQISVVLDTGNHALSNMIHVKSGQSKAFAMTSTGHATNTIRLRIRNENAGCTMSTYGKLIATPGYLQ